MLPNLRLAEEFLQQIACFVFAGVWSVSCKLAARQFEPLAVIGHVFLRDGVRSPIFALMGDAWIIADAIQADLKVGTAPVA